MFAKLLYILTAAIGVALLVFEIIIERSIAACTGASVALTRMLRILQILSIVMIIVPVVLLIATINSAGRLPLVLIGVISLLIVATLTTGLAAGIQIEMRKLGSCASFPISLWIPVGILVFIAVAAAVYKFKTRDIVNIAKQSVNWNNLYQNGRLIEEIGARQAKACNIKLEPGEAIAVLKNHIDTRTAEFKRKSGYIGRLFKRPPPLPEDKMPNIVKMYTQLEAEQGYRDVYGDKNIQTRLAEKRAAPKPSRIVEDEDEEFVPARATGSEVSYLQSLSSSVGGAVGWASNKLFGSREAEDQDEFYDAQEDSVDLL